MANTYTQLYIQMVFAVKGRESLIHPAWRDQLYKYTTAIIQNKGHKLLAINGMADHIHIFIGYNPNQTIPDLVETIKTDTNFFIKSNAFCPGKFSWQTGYGAFSYGRSQLSDVVAYIQNQQIHHQQRTFRDEYQAMLRKFEVDYKPEYLFDFLDDTHPEPPGS